MWCPGRSSEEGKPSSSKDPVGPLCRSASWCRGGPIVWAGVRHTPGATGGPVMSFHPQECRRRTDGSRGPKTSTLTDPPWTPSLKEPPGAFRAQMPGDPSRGRTLDPLALPLSLLLRLSSGRGGRARVYRCACVVDRGVPRFPVRPSPREGLFHVPVSPSPSGGPPPNPLRRHPCPERCHSPFAAVPATAFPAVPTVGLVAVAPVAVVVTRPRETPGCARPPDVPPTDDPAPRRTSTPASPLLESPVSSHPHDGLENLA